MRRAGIASAVAACVLAVASLAPVGAPSARVSAQSDEDDAARAAREIAEARERANRAAELLFLAQSDVETLRDDQERLLGELDDLRADVEELRVAVEAVAVSRFVASGSDGIPLLTDFRAPRDRVQADVLVGVVAESSATTLDDYEAARVRLAEKQDELEANEEALLETQERLEQLRVEAEAEVERLREVEQQRLRDESVRRALEAQQREQQRLQEEFQRRQAEAARRSTPNPAAVLVADANTSGSTGASGGTAGGRTGGGGGGSNPTAFGNGFIDAIACPVQGASAYGDTWGAPRSGGRRHQGVDMLAPTGTPLQAVVSGTVTQGRNPLGGIVVSLMGDNGNRYYYAHLAGYEGVSGRVEQAQVIGYVGDTGNATGVPHLHFEIRPGGGVPVNPTPSVRAAGC